MLETEVVVVGAGPAGLSAACAAAQSGAQVWLLDDQSAPGGQLFKQIHKFFGSKAHLAGTRGIQIGQDLLERARDSGVRTLLDTSVAGIFEGPLLAIVHDGKMDRLKASKIILATGADENPLAFPGWTLPGVMGAGAAQTLMHIHRVLPGQRVLMIGSGNVGLIVAFQLLQAGAEVTAVVEALPLVGGYWVHAAKLRRQGVPILVSHTVQRVRGRDRVEEAVIVELDEQGEPLAETEHSLEVDTVCVAVGLSPLTQLTVMAGCEHRWDSARGGQVPVHNSEFETTVPGLYVAGDLAGVEEASTAMEQGRVAGLAAAHALGRIPDPTFQEETQQALLRLSALRAHPTFSENQAPATYGRGGALSLSAAKTGVLSPSDLSRLPGVPSEERMRRGPVVVIECPETIPCDPCETSCAQGAVRLGGSLVSLPELDGERCNGCGLCVADCPGQAVFVVDLSYGPDEATVSFPYEFLPRPKIGAQVQGTDRKGEPVVAARVIDVKAPPKYNHTAVVTVAVPSHFAPLVRGIARE
ncbi:FAD-dependent oxidoreductase [Chloroflexota bacterium]